LTPMSPVAAAMAIRGRVPASSAASTVISRRLPDEGGEPLLSSRCQSLRSAPASVSHAPDSSRRWIALAAVGLGAAASRPAPATARQMSEEELQARMKRAMAGGGKGCQKPAVKSQSLGNVGTFLVDLPQGVGWRKKPIKGSLLTAVGGIDVMDTIFEERVVAEPPYTTWSLDASVHTVQFNNFETRGVDVEFTAKRLATTTLDKDQQRLPVTILAASRDTSGIAEADTIEYLVDGPKGPIHCLNWASAMDGRLYNVIAQAPEAVWPELEADSRAALTSARLCNRVSRFFAGRAGGS